MSKTAVKKKDTNTGVAVNYDYGEYQGEGFEDTTKDDFLIPFIKLGQAGTPQVIEGDMRPGDFLNTATEEIYDGETGVTCIVAKRDHLFVEWRDKDAGGGFMGTYEAHSDYVKNARKEGHKLFTEEGELVETFYLYLVILDENKEIAGNAVLPITSSKIKPYRQWMTKINQIKGKPPIFAHEIVISSFLDTPKKPGVPKFQNIDIKPSNSSIGQSMLAPDSAAFLTAREFATIVNAGEAQVDHAKQNDAGEAEGGETVPF